MNNDKERNRSQATFTVAESGLIYINAEVFSLFSNNQRILFILEYYNEIFQTFRHV